MSKRVTFVSTDGLTLVGEEMGTRGLPTVVLLHGGGQTRHSWKAAMQRVAGEGYHVIAYDARGHGESDWSPSGDYSPLQQSKDLLPVIESVPGPVALVGASMGGMTSFYTVGAHRPDKVKLLVLVDIVPRPARVGIDKIARFMGANQDGFASLDEAVDATAAYNPHRPRSTDPSGLMRNLRLRENGRLYWHWDPRLLGASVDVEQERLTAYLEAVAGEIDIPTVLLRGGSSDVVDDRGVADLRRMVPHAEVVDVAKAGHMIAGDRNDAFNEAILAYLNRDLSARAQRRQPSGQAAG